MPDSSSDYETILYERRGRIGLITLNRPEKLNAWNGRMEGEFIDAVNGASSGASEPPTSAGGAVCRRTSTRGLGHD